MNEAVAVAAGERSSCNQPPEWLGRLRARFPGFSARYLELDPRSAGLARIYLAGLLLVELLRHVPLLDVFFSDDGLLPAATVLASPDKYLFSVFFAARTAGQAAWLFAACTAVFLALLVGWHTRVCQVLSFIAILSLHTRTVMFEDGSEVSTRLLIFWTLFLPLGSRFSLDALRASPALRGGAPAETRPYVSLAVLAILLQLAAVYVFNSLHKNGQTWRQGTTVHYVLHQDRIVTWIGWMLRPYVTPAISAAMTWGALATEASLPILLLSPWRTPLARRLAIFAGIGLHVGFALLLNLGVFSANMIGFFLLLIPSRDWELLARSRLGRALQQRVAALLPALRARLGRREADAARAESAKSGGASLPAWLGALLTRETLVVIAALVLGQQLLRSNAAVPRKLRPHQPPELITMLVDFPRLYEGWSMFAPEAPTGDLHVFVDAHTLDGRHVDPLNELASRVASTPLAAIPERLEQNDSFCDYELAINGRKELLPDLRRWLFSYAERTGKPGDRIVSFRVIVMEDDSPPPGETEPRNTRTQVLLQARRPMSVVRRSPPLPPQR